MGSGNGRLCKRGGDVLYASSRIVNCDFFNTFFSATIKFFFGGELLKFYHTVFGGLNRPGVEFLQHQFTHKSLG